MSWPPPEGLFNRTKQAERALTLLQQHKQPQLAPVFQAVRARRIDFFMPAQTMKALPPALLAAANPPVPILMTITDTDNTAAGPDAWPCAVDALKWAHPGFYTSADPQGAEFMRLMVDLAIEHGRFLYVETSPEMVNAWRRMVGVEPERLAVV